MSDEELMQKYNNDPFFKVKLDLRVKKLAAQGLKHRVKH